MDSLNIIFMNKEDVEYLTKILFRNNTCFKYYLMKITLKL